MIPADRQLARKIRARIDAAFAADDAPVDDVIRSRDEWWRLRRQIARIDERLAKHMDELDRLLRDLKGLE